MWNLIFVPCSNLAPSVDLILSCGDVCYYASAKEVVYSPLFVGWFAC